MIKEKFLTKEEALKIKEKDERMELRRQYYKSKGYTDDKIHEILKNEFK